MCPKENVSRLVSYMAGVPMASSGMYTSCAWSLAETSQKSFCVDDARVAKICLLFEENVSCSEVTMYDWWPSAKRQPFATSFRRKTMKCSLPELSPRNRQDFCPL